MPTGNPVSTTRGRNSCICRRLRLASSNVGLSHFPLLPVVADSNVEVYRLRYDLDSLVVANFIGLSVRRPIPSTPTPMAYLALPFGPAGSARNRVPADSRIIRLVWTSSIPSSRSPRRTCQTPDDFRSTCEMNSPGSPGTGVRRAETSVAINTSPAVVRKASYGVKWNTRDCRIAAHSFTGVEPGPAVRDRTCLARFSGRKRSQGISRSDTISAHGLLWAVRKPLDSKVMSKWHAFADGVR